MNNKEKKNNSSQDSDKQVPEQKSESPTTKQYTYEEQNKIFNEELAATDKYEVQLMKEWEQKTKKRNLKKQDPSQDSINQIPKQKSESPTTKQYTYEEQNKIFNEGLAATDKYEESLMKEALQEIKQLNLKKTDSDVNEKLLISIFGEKAIKDIISALKLSAEMNLLNLQMRHLGYLKNKKVNEDGKFEKLDIIKNLRYSIDVYDLKLLALSKKRIHPNNWDEVNKIINNYSPEYISLILGGSSCSEITKINRLQAQINYASKDKVMYEKLKKYLLNLKDDEWYLYKGDKPSDVSFF